MPPVTINPFSFAPEAGKLDATCLRRVARGWSISTPSSRPAAIRLPAPCCGKRWGVGQRPLRLAR